MIDTSLEAYHAIPQTRRAADCGMIFEIVERHCNAGGQGISMKEIKEVIFYMSGLDPEVSTISARCNELLTAKRIERLKQTRKCNVTGASIHPIVLPRKQLSLI